jgi:hypothetical protein
MAKNNAASSAPHSRMPKAGVQYPKGRDKADLIARMRRAFAKVRIKHDA